MSTELYLPPLLCRPTRLFTETTCGKLVLQLMWGEIGSPIDFQPVNCILVLQFQKWNVLKWKHHDFVTLGFVTLPDLPVFVPCLISDLGGDNPRESDPALANIGFPVLSAQAETFVLLATLSILNKADPRWILLSLASSSY